MTDPRETLAHIQARVEAASDEPWFAEERDLDRPYNLTTVYNVFHNGDTPDRDLVAEAAYDNAEFIAHARTDVPVMAAALDAVMGLHRKTPIYEWCGFDLPSEQECHLGDDAHIELSNGEWGHVNIVEAWTCEECLHDTDDYMPDYPCPTIRAITTALEGETP